MVSRRVVVGAGAVLAVGGGLGGLRLAGRDDDLLRALGARPRPVPSPADTALLRGAAQEQAVLLDRAIAEGASAEVVAVLVAQRDALGPSDGTGDAAPSPSPSADTDASLAAAVEAAGLRREDDALTAVSADLGRVLAAVAAGLAQVALVLEQAA